MLRRWHSLLVQIPLPARPGNIQKYAGNCLLLLRDSINRNMKPIIISSNSNLKKCCGWGVSESIEYKLFKLQARCIPMDGRNLLLS